MVLFTVGVGVQGMVGRCGVGCAFVTWFFSNSLRVLIEGVCVVVIDFRPVDKYEAGRAAPG